MYLRAHTVWRALPAIAALWGLGWGAGPSAAAPPRDVPGDHWAAPAVTAITDADLVELFADATFRGTASLTKYDLANSLDSLVQALAARGTRLGPGGALPPMPYADVPGDHYAARAIRRLLWMLPGDKHLFRGGQSMTRLDMAVWLYALLQNAPGSAGVRPGPRPADVPGPLGVPASWTLAAGAEGLISRYPDGRFHPDRELTRYEMAYSMYQVVRWLTRAETPPPPAAADSRPPELRLFEPAEATEAKDFVVVARKKQITVAGIAADDTAVRKVTVNEREANLAFADAADLRKAALKGPAAVWFRVQVPAPAETERLTITVTDQAGNTVKCSYRLQDPAPDSPQVTQAATQPAGTQRVARKWALLVGINHYDDVENIPTLCYSVRDVTAVYDVLIDPARGGFSKDTVFLLTDNTADKPTNINVIKYLNRIARRAEPEDMVLFYFSGHGYEENGRGYLLPCNTDIEALAASAIDNTDFIDTLDRMKAQKLVTIVDACHSGALRRTGGGAPALSGHFYSAYGGGKGRVVLASSSAGQKSWEDARLGQGVFTQFIKQGLLGTADSNRDGAVTFLELATFTYEKVTQWAKANGKEQEPLIQAENFAAARKDIVLALNPTAIPSGPLADKKRVIYARLDPEDADYACSLLESSSPGDIERKILQYLGQMIAGKISPGRYLDFVRTMRKT